MKILLISILMSGTVLPQAKQAAPATKSAVKPNLMDPSTLKARAPETFKVKFATTKGDVMIQVTRAWAPNGADRFYNLVRAGYFTDVPFFRVIVGFMAQFGISGKREIAGVWANANIPDDRVMQSNKRGMVTYAQSSAKNSRSTQIFINYGDNSRLDKDGFAPFGQVIEGMENVDRLYSGYGDTPDQMRFQAAGQAYLDRTFPKLDKIISASLVSAAPTAAKPDAPKGEAKQ